MKIYREAAHIFKDINYEHNHFIGAFQRQAETGNKNIDRVALYTARQLCWSLELADCLARIYDGHLLSPHAQSQLEARSQTFFGNIADPHSLYGVLRSHAESGEPPGSLNDHTVKAAIADLTTHMHYDPKDKNDLGAGCPTPAMLGLVFSAPMGDVIHAMAAVKHRPNIPQSALDRTTLAQLLHRFSYRVVHAWQHPEDPLHPDSLALFASADPEFLDHNPPGFLSVALTHFIKTPNQPDYTGLIKFGQAMLESWQTTQHPIYQTMYHQWLGFIELPKELRLVSATEELDQLWHSRTPAPALPTLLQTAQAYQPQILQLMRPNQWCYMLPDNLRPMAAAIDMPMLRFHIRLNQDGTYDIHADIADPHKRHKKLITAFHLDLGSTQPVSAVTLDAQPLSPNTQAKIMQLVLRSFELFAAEPQPTTPPPTASAPSAKPFIGKSGHQPGPRFQEPSPSKRPRRKNHRHENATETSQNSTPNQELHPRPIVVLDDADVKAKINKLSKKIQKAIGHSITANNKWEQPFVKGKDLGEGAVGPEGGKVWQITVGKYRVLCEIREDGQAYVYRVALRGDPDRFKND